MVGGAVDGLAVFAGCLLSVIEFTIACVVIEVPHMIKLALVSRVTIVTTLVMRLSMALIK